MDCILCDYSAVAPAIPDSPWDSCNPSPCGPNAVSKQSKEEGFCVRLQGYFDDPYRNCLPECIFSTHWPRDKAYVNNQCRNLCRVTCGISADCQVVNHSLCCSCLPSYSENPFISCHVVQPSKICFFLCFIICHTKSAPSVPNAPVTWHVRVNHVQVKILAKVHVDHIWHVLQWKMHWCVCA